MKTTIVIPANDLKCLILRHLEERNAIPDEHTLLLKPEVTFQATEGKPRSFKQDELKDVSNVTVTVTATLTKS